MKECRKPKEAGFTLIELMVSMVMALIIIAGLFLNFSTQNTEYSYQNRRIDSVQNLEFTLKFVADDLRSALMQQPIATVDPNPDDTANFAGAGATTSLTFWVWDPDAADTAGNVDATTNRAQRTYTWSTAQESLRYDRMIQTIDGGGIVQARAIAPGEILDSVTFFKVFRDDIDVASRAAFADIPPPMVTLTVNDTSGGSVNVPGYTILIEVAVPAGYTKGRMIDVLGNNLTGTADQRKRIWRYVQVYPMALVN